MTKISENCFFTKVENSLIIKSKTGLRPCRFVEYFHPASKHHNSPTFERSFFPIYYWFFFVGYRKINQHSFNTWGNSINIFLSQLFKYMENLKKIHELMLQSEIFCICVVLRKFPLNNLHVYWRNKNFAPQNYKMIHKQRFSHLQLPQTISSFRKSFSNCHEKNLF